MAKDIQQYLSRSIGKDDGKDLQTYLQSRLDNSESKKSLEAIFLQKSELLTSQQKMKAQLTTRIN